VIANVIEVIGKSAITRPALDSGAGQTLIHVIALTSRFRAATR
jgi:hypothetical protein